MAGRLNVKDVSCPYCGARPFRPCYSPSGYRMGTFHRARFQEKAYQENVKALILWGEMDVVEAVVDGLLSVPASIQVRWWPWPPRPWVNRCLPSV